MTVSVPIIFLSIAVIILVIAGLLLLNRVERLERGISYDEDRFIELEEKVNNICKD